MVQRRLDHSDGEVEQFYRDLKAQGISVRVGLETTRYSRWFERLLAELGFEVWIGDAAEIKTKRAKKQKTDRQGAQLLPVPSSPACESNSRDGESYSRPFRHIQ